MEYENCCPSIETYQTGYRFNKRNNVKKNQRSENTKKQIRNLKMLENPLEIINK
jgi:hypothetical protein